jgi:hypothetical protein
LPAINISGAAGSTQIVGLRDFQRALSIAGKGFSLAIKEANVIAAKELVSVAKGKAESLGSVAAKSAKSLRASFALNYSAVNLGGGRYPFALGAEFGAKQYRQFKSWRGNQFEGWEGGPGYFLFPSLREHGEEIVKRYFDRIDRLTDEAFPDPV